MYLYTQSSRDGCTQSNWVRTSIESRRVFSNSPEVLILIAPPPLALSSNERASSLSGLKDRRNDSGRKAGPNASIGAENSPVVDPVSRSGTR
ncbi:hypothetical protein Q7C36_014531 [Tachysurus vachellii]|uniref:Uncharacterized protein n=1 Tax=Tachysurus vachellii TaxID=175792 RepID=A0AA88MES7_TACVA|nr:hypothetical protein Q7C36_014531 [Tachysurus vachellii]